MKSIINVGWLIASNWIRANRLWLVIGAIAASVGGTAYFVNQYKEGQAAQRELKAERLYLEEYKRQQDAYNQKLKELTEAALKRQQELAAINTANEKRYHEANKRAEAIRRKYDRLVADGFRLRDPKVPATIEGTRSAQGSSSATPNSSNRSASGGELSREATQFLLNFANDADRVVEQLKAAQDYAKQLHSLCSKP